MEMQKQTKKIVLTGGHAATTAYSVVEEIKKRKLGLEIFWVGPKKAIEGREILTLSFQLLPKLGVCHCATIGGRLQRKWTVWTIPSLLKIPVSFVQSFLFLIKIRPSIIVSFGGYAAFPVVVCGWVLGIPIIIHEQTSSYGLANRISSFFARKIAIARDESRAFFPKKKVVLTGNPVMAKIVEVGRKENMGNPPTIYITGGSTGAQRINTSVDKILEILLTDFQVIHQTGELDFAYFKSRKEKLNEELKKNYNVEKFIEPDLVDRIFKKSDILVSRAGANTISEIMITARPSVIVPISWSRNGEQAKNAEAAKNAGIAVVIDENEITAEILLERIFFLKRNWKKMIASMNTNLAKLDTGASARMVDLIKEQIF